MKKIGIIIKNPMGIIILLIFEKAVMGGKGVLLLIPKNEYILKIKDLVKSYTSCEQKCNLFIHNHLIMVEKKKFVQVFFNR